MQLFVKADVSGLISGAMHTNSNPGNEWVAVEGDATTATKVLTEAYVLDAGVLVPTGQPRFPRKAWETWDAIHRQWVDPRTPEEKSAAQWAAVREERDRLLAVSDWTQLPDVPLATKEAWATYRQALRDITEQSDPFAIIWPTLPTSTE